MILVRKCGPNKAMVKSGVCYSKPKIVKGGRVFQVVCFHTVQRLKLNLMTIEVYSRNVNCSNGVRLTCTGVAQCKINAETDESLQLACRNFLGMKEDKIKTILNETLEGQQRGIISLMTVEEVYRDREQFNTRVFEGCKTDLLNMGIHIVSYTVKEISTDNGYLESLGKPAVALVHRDARIGEATCHRDADINTAQRKEETDKKYFETRREIEKMTNEKNLVLAENKKAINTAQAIAQNAKRLAEAEYNKSLKAEQMQIEIIEKAGEARVMQEEQKLVENKLEHSVRLRAETDKYKTEIEANAQKQATILKNEAAAANIEIVSSAEAESTRLKAEAEARATALKAKAYEQYGQAALVGEVLKTLPQLAAEVARPAMDMKKVKIVSTDAVGLRRITGEVMGIMDDVPVGVHNMTGIDLKGEIRRVMER